MTILTKEAFFRDLLVPTGQITEILLKLVSKYQRRDDHTALVHSAFEPLNLASCFAINPVNTDLRHLAGAVQEYQDAMLRIFKSFGAHRAPYIATALGVRHNSRSTTVQNAARKSVADLRQVLAFMPDKLYAAIGYTPATRSKWLATQTETETPLTRGGTTNKWRTFVRHLSWKRCVELLDIASAVPVAYLTENTFTHNVGIAEAAPLWRETFAVRPSTAGEEPSVALAAEPGRLPTGVSVQSTSAGELQVEVNFDPRLFLDKVQTKSLKVASRPVSDSLAETLAVRRFRKTCDVVTLAASVEEASSWLAEQNDSREAVLAAYAQWQDEMRIKAVRDKLDSHFNVEERRILASIFAAEAAAA